MIMFIFQGSKMYPRDQNRDPTFRGRVRVQLKNADGTYVLEQFKTSKFIYFSKIFKFPEYFICQERDTENVNSSKSKQGIVDACIMKVKDYNRLIVNIHFCPSSKSSSYFFHVILSLRD